MNANLLMKKWLLLINGYFLMMAAFLISGCFSRSSVSRPTRQHIQLMVNYPLVQMPGPRLTELPDTIQYYYYDNYIAIGLPVRLSVENSAKILQQSISYSWFVYQEGSDYGYFFDSVNAFSSRKLKVDSLLFNRAYAARFNVSKDSLVSSIRDKKSGVLMETFVPRNKQGEFSFDSTYYYYSNEMANLKYSLSRSLDSSRGMKLFKVRLSYNEQFSQNYGIILPRRQFVFEIRELPFQDRGFVALIDRVRTGSGL